MFSKFILNDKNISRDSYLWNTIGSFFIAFESVIILAFMQRTIGLVLSGIFSIAIADANLFLNMGKYGMRSFQASDVSDKFSFKTYRNSRIITTALMIICSIGFVIYSALRHDYSAEKTAIIIITCLFKVTDSVEDIFYGEYQRRGRLDVSGRCLAVRTISTTLVLSIMLFVTKNLLLSLIVATIYTATLLIILITITKGLIGKTTNSGQGSVKKLLIHCFPVAVGFFMSFYIGNAPKYAIDACLSDEIQACFGFISMPIFVIGLLNGLIFNPSIYSMSKLWGEGQYGKFLKRLMMQLAIIVGITIVCIAGGYLLGIPVLSILYSTDLSMYKMEFILLLVGGGCLAINGLFSTVLTIIRKQFFLLIGYSVVSLVALIGSNQIVVKYGITGAVYLYDTLMALLALAFALTFAIAFVAQKRKGVEAK